MFLAGLRVCNAVLEAGTASDLAIAWVLSTSVKSPVSNLAASNGLRPGLAVLIKQLADEVGPGGTQVVGLMPGRIETERVLHLDSLAEDPAAARAAGEAATALRRSGTPKEFALVAAFVLSPAASTSPAASSPSRAVRCERCEPRHPRRIAWHRARRRGHPRRAVGRGARAPRPAVVDNHDQVRVAHG